PGLLERRELVAFDRDALADIAPRPAAREEVEREGRLGRVTGGAAAVDDLDRQAARALDALPAGRGVDLVVGVLDRPARRHGAAEVGPQPVDVDERAGGRRRVL